MEHFYTRYPKSGEIGISTRLIAKVNYIDYDSEVILTKSREYSVFKLYDNAFSVIDDKGQRHTFNLYEGLGLKYYRDYFEVVDGLPAFMIPISNREEANRVLNAAKVRGYVMDEDKYDNSSRWCDFRKSSRFFHTHQSNIRGISKQKCAFFNHNDGCGSKLSQIEIKLEIVKNKIKNIY